MDYLIELLLAGIEEFSYLAVFLVICRIIVLCLSLECVGVIVSHLTSVMYVKKRG